MLEQIVSVAVRVYTHELSRSIVNDPQLTSANDGGYRRLSGTIRDANDNMAAELATYALRDELKDMCPVHSIVSRWYPSSANVLTYMQSHRAYAELDGELLHDISVVARDLENSYDSIVKAITLCYVFELGEPLCERILDQLFAALYASEKVQDSVHTYRSFMLNESENNGVDSEIVEQSQHPDTSIAPFIGAILADVAIGIHDPSSWIRPEDWKLLARFLSDRLEYNDISFMQSVPRSVTDIILRRFGFPSLVTKHLTRLLQERLADFPSPVVLTDTKDEASVRPIVVSRQEFGERLFQLFHQHGNVGASTKLTLIELCTKRSGKLMLRAPGGYFWATKIAEVVAHKLEIDEGELKLENNGKPIDQEQRGRALKRGDDRKENPAMQQLVAEIAALNVVDA